MKKVTLYIAGDGSQFTSEVECLEHEQAVRAKMRSALLDEYNRVHIWLQHMKGRFYSYGLTLSQFQDDVIKAKKRFLDAKKHGVKASKSERFEKLALLQYAYYNAKLILKTEVEKYRKNKDRLHKLSKRLGFHGACPAGEEVCDGK